MIHFFEMNHPQGGSRREEGGGHASYQKTSPGRIGVPACTFSWAYRRPRLYTLLHFMDGGFLAAIVQARRLYAQT